MKNSNFKEQRKLLKGYGFTWLSAFKILIFSIVFSSIGLCAFVVSCEYSFVKVKNNVVQKFVSTCEDIEKIYTGAQDNKGSYIAEKLISSSVYKFPKAVTYGPKDLNLDAKTALIEVKGQKLKLTENLYKVRFTDKK